MCGKSSLSNSASVLSESSEPDRSSSSSSSPVKSGQMADTPRIPSPTPTTSNGKVKVNKATETPEERKRRRKQERKKRRLGQLRASGNLPLTLNGGRVAPKRLQTKFNRVWDRETEFVSQVMQCLPEVRQPGLLLEEDERAEEYLNQPHDLMDEKGEKDMARKFHAKVRRNLKEQGVEVDKDRAKSYQELRERLHRKLAEMAQQPNEEKREKKLKKKLKRAQEKKENSNKGKKLISQTAKSAGGTSTSSTTAEDSSSNSNSNATASANGHPTEKTPLKKKPVVKSNGEIVYSKFDFISKHKGDAFSSSLKTSGGVGAKAKAKSKPKSDELLKRVEKHEKQISHLATKGKQSEAVSLAETQKWETALKRADGEKVRDDAHLLKKSIKKQEKLKQLSKKKWKERIDRVEKQKQERQQKRQSNLQARKDDKAKRTKKLMRKRGRIV